MNQEKIGKFIAKCRKNKNLTQEELAEKLNVSDRTIGNWENGRNMPDLSLFKPLCDELDITINDLMSGEIINKKEYQEKSNENIVNTINYSNKKIKRIKISYMFITIFFSIILITLLVLFGIDVRRMRNNKPVFFSTWGFKYAPSINLDSINIENEIKKYLIEEDEKNSYHENEKSFVAMKVYHITEKQNNKYYVYAWVLQEKYYKENENIIKDTSSSIPYKFELIKENDKFIINDYNIPRDGSYYDKDMKHIFPKSVLKNMDTIHNDGTIEKLSLEIQNEVILYFHN